MFPAATSTSKPTLDYVVFMIQQLTTSVNYGFNDMRSNFEVMLQENKSLKEEIALLKQQVTELKEEVGTLKVSLDNIPSADSIETVATIGLFAGNLFPDRNISEPRINDKRPGRKDHAAPFSWKHFQRLIDEVRGAEHEKIGNEMLDACKVNVSPVLVKIVIDGIKRKFAIKEDSAWQSVPGDSRLDAIQELEAKASPYIPLRACVGSWGANMLLDHYWSSIRRRNKKQTTNGTDKGTQTNFRT